MATLHANLKSVKRETTTEKSNSYLNNGSKIHVLPGILLSKLNSSYSCVSYAECCMVPQREHFKSTIFYTHYLNVSQTCYCHKIALNMTGLTSKL